VITDDEMAELPSDPELAFVAVEKILRNSLERHEFDAKNNDYNPDPSRLEYMTKVLASARAYNINALDELKVPRVTKLGLDKECQNFTADVDFVTMQIRLNSARFNREGTVKLDQTTKRKIHHFIQQIRDAIDECDELDSEKKGDLLNKLNKFAFEVDRARTRLQAGMMFFATVCAGIGDGFEKLKPVRDMFDSVSGLLGQAIHLEEHFSPRLPGPSERKRLEPPSPRPPEPEISQSDDDIPF
jgi:hypothetical protein